jgi:hypothetical protein
MKKIHEYNKSAIRRKNITEIRDTQSSKERKQSMNRLSGIILDILRSEFTEVMERNLELNPEERKLIEEILDESVKNSKIIFTTNIMKSRKIKFQ